MSRLFHSLFVLLATACRQELARQVRYLKAENEVLRSKLPKRVHVTPKERNRLVRLGRKLGSKVIRKLVTIVSPVTFLRWLREKKSLAELHLSRISLVRFPGFLRSPVPLS